MQSDSSSKLVDVNNDATTSRTGDVWARDLDSLESFVTDENKFNQTENLKDKQTPDASKTGQSASNLFNDCTNKSTDNSTDKTTQEKSSDKSNGSTFNEKCVSDHDEEMDEDDDENDDDDSNDNPESNSDEESDEIDDEQDDKSKKPKKRRKKVFERRNIKRLIREKDLDEKVLAARKEEEERINRILEQQKQLKSEKQHQIPTTSARVTEDIVLSSDDEVQVLESSGEGEDDIVISYERIQDEIDAANSGLHTDDSLNTLNSKCRCLVNIGHPSADPDIFLDDFLARKVKPHQIGGIRFMYDCIVENLTKVKTSDGIGGCILAHSMGLGKTLQVIAFSELFLRVTGHKRILCIVPVNTIQNWITEFDQWLPDKEGLSKIDELFASKPTTSQQEDNVKNENDDDHLVLRKPRQFAVYTLTDSKTFTQKASEIRKWYKNGGVLLMGYEAYRTLFSDDDKKKKAKKSKYFDGLSKAEYFQLLKELGRCLIDPGPDLVICDEGHRIKNCKSSISKSLKEIRTRRRVILTGYPLQNNLVEYWCMVDFVRPEYLGTRPEFVNMFERPIQNGQCVDSDDGDRILARKRAHVLHKLLIGFVQRRSFKILFHTLPPKQEFCLYVRMTPLQKYLLIAFFHNLQSLHFVRPFANNPLYIYSVCYKIWNHSDVLYRKMLEADSREDEITQSISRKNLKSLNPDYPEEDELNYDWANQVMQGYQPGVLENSTKMILLFKIIEETIKLRERILIFSQSLVSLDVIEDFLCQREVPNDKKKRKFERMVNYLRLDGSTASLDRKNYIDRFNKNRNYHLFLISTKAGSLGINLTGANRLVVLDVSFNPCHDAQAVHRIYRYGQKKECFVYRFIFDNSLEKRIFDRQISKQGMSNQVVDEINTDTNLSWNEINSMVDGLEAIEEPPIPEFSEDELNEFSDPIMRTICREYNHCLTKKPLPHESLLAESEETKLSRAEKQMAEWEYNYALQGMKRNNASAKRWDSLQSNANSQPTIQPQSQQQQNQLIYNTQQSFQNDIQDNSRTTMNNTFSNGVLNGSPQQSQQPFNIFPSASSMPNNYNRPNYVNNVPNHNGQSILSTPVANRSFGQLNAPECSNALVPLHSHNSFSSTTHQANHTTNDNGPSSSTNNYYNPLKNATYNNEQQQQFISRERSAPLIRNFVIPTDLKIKDDSGTEIALKKNQLVHLIQTDSSLILRTFSGKQVHIRGAFANFFISTNQPNLINVRHHHAQTASNSPPEVIDLGISDEE